MTRRVVWTRILWALTVAAVGVEVYGAVTDNGATWTESLVRSVPAPLVLAGAAWLSRWLPAHFEHAYAQAGGGPVMGEKAKFWVSIIGAMVSAGLTVALQTLPASDNVVSALTIAAVVVSTGLTALGVYQVPNKPPALGNLEHPQG